MKKLLYIFILFPLFAIGQTVEDWNYEPCMSYDMSVCFQQYLLSEFVGYEMKAYAVKYEYEGPADAILGIPPIDSTLVPVSHTYLIEEETLCMSISATDDYFDNCLQANNGDLIRFFISTEAGYITVNTFPEITFITNSFSFIDNVSFSINSVPVDDGCYFEGQYYYPNEIFHCGCFCDNGGVICLDIDCDGCLDPNACNYDYYNEFDGPPCEYPEEGFDCNGNCLIDINSNGICDLYEILGCIDATALNYNNEANTDDGSCIPFIYGCMDSLAFNYNAEANIDDGSCIEIIQGCTNPAANNYNPNATSYDNSCIYPMLNPWGGWTNETNQESPSYETTDYLSVLFPVQNADIWDTESDIDVGDVIFAVYETYRFENLLVGYSHFTGVESAGAASWTGNQIEMNIWGSDYGENNGYMNSELIKWLVLKADGEIYNATVNYITPLFNGNYESGISITVNSVNIGNNFFEGCMDPTSLEFNPIVTVDDGSCTTFYSIGCLDISAINYAGLNSNPSNELANNFWDPYGENLTLDLLTGQQYPSGIAANTADNSMCQYIGCTSDWADNYDELSSIDDSSCFKLGCFDNLAINFDEFVTDNDGSCEYDIITQLNQSFDAWNVSINLQEGWNMIGYGCPNPIDLVEGLSNHTESILIVKDNNGEAYLPEWNFNGIGDLIPGFGYQIKVTEAIEGFSLCDWYVNDIPEDNILSLQEEVENLQSELDSIYGCTDISACNFDETAVLDDGSCYNNDLGCGCDAPGPIGGFDCNGNELIAAIGDTVFGGILFYVDETGQHGLVAAMEDLTEGATDPYEYGFNGYEWGCYQQNIDGAYGTSIGTGYQNTMDIVNHGCSTENGGITAAQAALDADINGYSDWYLPSLDELKEIYNTIGDVGPEGNIGGLQSDFYLSSSESINGYGAQAVDFYDGHSGLYSKSNTYRVRVIRAF